MLVALHEFAKKNTNKKLQLVDFGLETRREKKIRIKNHLKNSFWLTCSKSYDSTHFFAMIRTFSLFETVKKMRIQQCCCIHSNVHLYQETKKPQQNLFLEKSTAS